jgi:Gnt-I system low-affinity gluconate transporter
MEGYELITAAILGIIVLLILVIKYKLHAFVALMLVSIVVGLMSGMPLAQILKTIEKGMGSTLGFVAVVVGLGAMFGKMLEVSGGIERLSSTLLDKFGDDKSQWALGIAGFLVAIPVFFDVGFIILVPVVYGLAKKSGRSLLYYAVPLLAGLAVTHAFIPPTPGPIAVASLVNADLGWVIFFGAIVGVPAMIISGPLFGRFISKHIHVTKPSYMEDENEKKIDYSELPSFRMIFCIILIPLVLIVLNTFSAAILSEENVIVRCLMFLGHPYVALIIAVMLTFSLLGTKRGLTREQVQDIATKALEPVGIIILVTGAGGVFKMMLIDSGAGDVLANIMSSSNLPPIVLAFLIAAVVRIIQGSATVAMITAAGLITPILGTATLSPPTLGLIVISIASGATVMSHVNDSGFWLVNRYLGLNVKETLKTWTVMETIIGLVGFAGAATIGAFI